MFNQIVASLKKSKYNPYVDVLKKDDRENRTYESLENNVEFSYKTVFSDDTIKDFMLDNSIFMSQYKIVNVIKNNANKGVFVVEDNNSNKFICRVRKNDKGGINEHKVYDALKNNKSEYICNYYSSFHAGGFIFFIMEYIDGDILCNHIKNNLPCPEKVRIIKDIIKGIGHLHSNNVIHCDIKLENVMIDKDGHVKLIDYDMSKFVDNDYYMSDSIFGTSKYIAPESYDLSIYSFKSDIWSLGILIYVMFSKKYPFNIPISLTNSYSNLFRRNEFKHPDLSYLKDCIDRKAAPPKVLDIILKMLNYNIINRATLEEVDELFKDVCKN